MPAPVSHACIPARVRRLRDPLRATGTGEVLFLVVLLLWDEKAKAAEFSESQATQAISRQEDPFELKRFPLSSQRQCSSTETTYEFRRNDGRPAA